MKYGLDVGTVGDWSDIRRLTELAVEAESAGWDGFFLWEILMPDDDSPVADPWVALASIAAATNTITLGVMVTPLPRRQPWDVARQLASLDHLSGGRMIFAAGLGYSAREFERLGLSADPRLRAEQLDESLELIGRLWSGEAATSKGRHYKLDGARLLPVPVQRSRIPIWTAAGWPRRPPLRRAISWDGVYLMTNNQLTDERITADEVAEVTAFVRSERQIDAPFEVAANVFTPAELDGGTAVTLAMAAAGATWTVELAPDSFEEHRALVRRGPITIDGRV